MFLPCFLLARCSQWLLDYDLNAPSAGGECIVSIIRSNAKSSTLWGAALFVLHGFYGAVKERIRTALAPRFAPHRGVSRARLGESLRAHLKKRIAMYFCNAHFVLILGQNSFSSISSAASVYCPFASRSFLS